MESVQKFGAHVLSYAMSGLAFVAGIDPSLLAAHPKAAAAVGAAGLILTAIHNVQTAGAPKPGTVTTIAKALLPVALGVMFAASLVACKTAPTVKEQSVVAVSVNIAAGRAIQQNDSDPAVWKTRAASYKSIALRIQTVNDASTATIATLGAELQPLIAKLGPADQLAARSLIAAVTPYLQEQADANADVANVRERVSYILATFITACEAYGG